MFINNNPAKSLLLEALKEEIDKRKVTLAMYYESAQSFLFKNDHKVGEGDYSIVIDLPGGFPAATFVDDDWGERGHVVKIINPTNVRSGIYPTSEAIESFKFEADAFFKLAEERDNFDKNQWDILTNHIDVGNPIILLSNNSDNDPRVLAIVMKKKTCSLLDYIRKFRSNKEKINPEIALRWMEELTTAIDFLHENKIIHRDLALRNTLINKESNMVSICDFGISRVLGKNEHVIETHSILNGPFNVMSPQEIEEGKCSVETENYMHAMLLIELITEMVGYPFNDFQMKVTNGDGVVAFSNFACENSNKLTDIKNVLNIYLKNLKELLVDRKLDSDYASLINYTEKFIGSRNFNHSLTNKLDTSVTSTATISTSTGENEKIIAGFKKALTLRSSIKSMLIGNNDKTKWVRYFDEGAKISNITKDPSIYAENLKIQYIFALGQAVRKYTSSPPSTSTLAELYKAIDNAIKASKDKGKNSEVAENLTQYKLDLTSMLSEENVNQKNNTNAKD